MKTDILTNWFLGLANSTSPFFAVYSFLIQTTVYLSVTALLIILFKLIFKNSLKAKWHFLIWTVLLIRLIIPSLPTSPVSVFNTVKVDENVVIQSSFRNYINEDTKSEDDGEYTVAKGLQKMIEADNDDVPENKSEIGYTIQIDAIVTYIWAGGTLFLLGYFITILAVYRHKLKKRRMECDDNTLHMLDICKEKLNIKRNIALYFADTTPMLIGLVKPSIYIPENLSEAEKETTLFHELSHMKHLDILWSAVATLVLCLNWFNPIMWLSFFIFKRDIEVYCDQRTLKFTESKQSYAMLLFKTATSGKEKYVLGTTSLQSGKTDVKRRIRYMAKFKKPTLAITAVAVMMATLILLSCLTNAQGEKEISTIKNPANGCKMDIVLNEEFAGDDYLSGDGTLFQFRTYMALEEIADMLITDNEMGIKYQDDKQVLLVTDNRENFPFLLLTKKVSDTKGNDVDDIVFLEGLGANEYLYDYDESFRLNDDDFITYKKYSYYFPEYLRADYRYTNYSGSSYNLQVSNPFNEEIKLLDNDNNFQLLNDFYTDIYHYSTANEDENGGGEILIANITGEPLFKIFYNNKTKTVKFEPYAAFAGDSAKSVIYRLENAIQRQDRELLENCFASFSDDDYKDISRIKPDMYLTKILVNGIDNVNNKYIIRAFAHIEYSNSDMGSNLYDKSFQIEYMGEDPKITYTNLPENSESEDIYTNTEQKETENKFVSEILGEPEILDVDKIDFYSLPDVLYADTEKAILGGDCGIIVYSFGQEEITLRASYTYLQKLGVSLPYGNTSADGRYVYINDGMRDIAGA